MPNGVRGVWASQNPTRQISLPPVRKLPKSLETSEVFRSRRASFLPVDIVFQHGELLEEVVLLDAHGAFEEASQVAQNAGFPAALGEEGLPGQVQNQGRRQDRVAPLPGEL